MWRDRDTGMALGVSVLFFGALGFAHRMVKPAGAHYCEPSQLAFKDEV